ncbi:ABC transporter ATP-binding protein [Ruicaihuangia caeni]|uniref:ATP-binding cassette domain-containing protein n=1 Tax=Ruicaihuangia caeni TaxID=3042517 RepID=A0AAW6T9C9_9MICO|nr:ATP-binding cassette domain-containing protein [Klugiella sp. YN-L-19]MDI2098373.1 ATP-binding cassette domain-containing protein [Klugiella sp. YN-L-19]
MLELRGIVKNFGDRRALNDVSFAVRSGRITGFVGGNGAGKTTAMRVILGVLRPDAGAVTLDGQPLTPAVRSGFGYMPEERGLYPKMKVAEQIEYLGRLHGMAAADARRATTELLEQLDLADRADATVESLSLGNQQRAQIAAALVHDPGVLVLDEPFSGLDPMAVDTVLAVLKRFADKGARVLFSSHQLDIVERLCDDLVVIAGGEVRAAGSRDELRAAHTRNRYELHTSKSTEWLHSEPSLTVLELDGGRAVFETDEPAAAQEALRRASTTGPVLRFGPLHPSLADIFKEVVR